MQIDSAVAVAQEVEMVQAHCSGDGSMNCQSVVQLSVLEEDESRMVGEDRLLMFSSAPCGRAMVGSSSLSGSLILAVMAICVASP